MRTIVAAAFALSLLVAAPQAFAAAGENEIRVGPLVGLDFPIEKGAASWGLGFDGAYYRNLTDFWAVGAEVLGVRLFDEPDTTRLGFVGQARYVLDALRWVPWGSVGVGLGTAHTQAAGWASAHPIVIAGAGIDFRPGRYQALGVGLHRHFVFDTGIADGSFWSVRFTMTWFSR